MFDAAGADFYQLWVAEVLPTYSRGQDAGSLLKYRAHFDCDGCRQGASEHHHASCIQKPWLAACPVQLSSGDKAAAARATPMRMRDDVDKHGMLHNLPGMW